MVQDLGRAARGRDIQGQYVVYWVSGKRNIHEFLMSASSAAEQKRVRAELDEAIGVLAQPTCLRTALMRPFGGYRLSEKPRFRGHGESELVCCHFCTSPSVLRDHTNDSLVILRALKDLNVACPGNFCRWTMADVVRLLSGSKSERFTRKVPGDVRVLSSGTRATRRPVGTRHSATPS